MLNTNNNSNNISSPEEELLLQNNNASNNANITEIPLQTNETLPNTVADMPNPTEVDKAKELINLEAKAKAANIAAEDKAAVAAKEPVIRDQLTTKIAEEKAVQNVVQSEQQKTQNDLTQIQKEIDDEQSSLKNLSVEDIVKNRSTANKIFAGLGMLLGGIGGAMTGSNRNLGVEAWNKSLDDEFEQQKLTQSEKLAKKQRIYDLLKLKIDTLSNQTNDKLKQDQFNLAKQQLDLQKQATLQQQVALKQQALLNEKARSGELNPDQEAVYVSSLSPEDRKRYVVGFGLAKDPETAKKAAEQINIADQAKMQIDTIKNLFKEYGTREVLDRGAVAAEQTARRNLQLQMKELFNLGVLNGPDLKLVEEATGDDFFALTTSDAAKNAKLASIESFIKTKVNAALKNAGLNPVGNSKRDLIIDKYKQEGLSDSQAAERYNKLVQSGLIK